MWNGLHKSGLCVHNWQNIQDELMGLKSNELHAEISVRCQEAIRFFIILISHAAPSIMYYTN